MAAPFKDFFVWFIWGLLMVTGQCWTAQLTQKNTLGASSWAKAWWIRTLNYSTEAVRNSLITTGSRHLQRSGWGRWWLQIIWCTLVTVNFVTCTLGCMPRHLFCHKNCNSGSLLVLFSTMLKPSFLLNGHESWAIWAIGFPWSSHICFLSYCAKGFLFQNCVPCQLVIHLQLALEQQKISMLYSKRTRCWTGLCSQKCLVSVLLPCSTARFHA